MHLSVLRICFFNCPFHEGSDTFTWDMLALFDIATHYIIPFKHLWHERNMPQYIQRTQKKCITSFLWNAKPATLQYSSVRTFGRSTDLRKSTKEAANVTVMVCSEGKTNGNNFYTKT